jgi:hypothetical protein
MTRLARVLVFALIAVFAAWSAAHVANATTMALEMATVEGDGMDMAGCDACDSEEMGDQASLACDVTCVSPVLVDLATTSQAFTSAPTASHAIKPLSDLAGRSYPPEPHPPRSVLLI